MKTERKNSFSVTSSNIPKTYKSDRPAGKTNLRRGVCTRGTLQRVPRKNNVTLVRCLVETVRTRTPRWRRTAKRRHGFPGSFIFPARQSPLGQCLCRACASGGDHVTRSAGDVEGARELRALFSTHFRPGERWWAQRLTRRGGSF